MKRLGFLISLLTLTTIAATAQKQTQTVGNGKHYEVTISTSQGAFTVKLHNETPLHRDSFVKLAKDEFYKGIIFHRVIKGFVTQAGDPSSKEASQVKTYGNNSGGSPIPAEIVPQYYHKKGALGAAREGDDVNPERKSSGSQFYIVTGTVLTDSTKTQIEENIKKRGSLQMTPEREKVYRTTGGTPHLDGVYTVFGEVIRGQNVVDKINSTSTYKNDRPKDDVYIKKTRVKIVKDKR